MMNRKFMLILMAVALLGMALAPVTANAVTTYTLDELINLGSTGITIDDKVFYDFGYTPAASGGAVTPPASGVTVTPITTALSPGLQFTASWAAAAGQTSDAAITYKVEVLQGGPPIVDASASMTGGVTGNGSLTLDETLYNEPTSSYLPTIALSPSVLSSTVTFAATDGPIDVTKDIGLNGGTSGSSSVSVVNQIFSEVPIPPSVLLLGSGLVGLLGLRRFRKH